MTVVSFLIGLVIGAMLGFMIFALVKTASDIDRQEERRWRE